MYVKKAVLSRRSSKEIPANDMASHYKVDIAMLRLLAIIIVVAFHAYGMCYAEAHLPQPLPKVYQETYEWFNQYIPINVAIPLFVFVSGYLFGMQLQKGRYKSLWQVAKDKLLRLGVPFYFFMPIMMATYSGFSLEPYYTGGYWHLWFLPMLWWMFITTFIMRSIILSKNIWMVICFLLFTYSIALFDRFLPWIFGLHNLNLWLCFFVLGVIVFMHERKVAHIIDSFLIYPLIAIYLITTLWFPTEYGCHSVASLIGNTSALLVLWSSFHRIPWNRFRITTALLSLSACSFGIYIFHNWVEVYLISSTAQRLFPISAFAERHVVLFPMIFSLSAFAISYVLTKLLLMLKIGRFVLK